MKNRIMYIQLSHKRKITGGKHEIAWGDSQDWQKGTVHTTTHNSWSVAKEKFALLKDKFKIQGYAIKAKIIS